MMFLEVDECAPTHVSVEPIRGSRFDPTEYTHAEFMRNYRSDPAGGSVVQAELHEWVGQHCVGDVALCLVFELRRDQGQTLCSYRMVFTDLNDALMFKLSSWY